MGSLTFAVFLAIIGLVVMFVPVPEVMLKLRRVGSAVLFGLAGLFCTLGGFQYNDAGYCQHVRTILGTESAVCDTGWYFSGWGSSTSWPHYITISHTTDMIEGDNASFLPFSVRMADNWQGHVIQKTRFGLPQDDAQFLKMARDFRSPERLINTVLVPAVTSSLDSVANMFTMEEYWAEGKRDTFKSEFSDAVSFGRAEVRQVSLNRDGGVIQGKAAPNDDPAAQDTAVMEDLEVRKVIVEKIRDASGNIKRFPHDYSDYGIVVSSAILETIDPDDDFEDRIKKRKDAASRRIIAQEERREQEEQRLLEIQKGETEIAKKKAEAEVVQIQRTTDAETEKKLTLIEAGKIKEQAAVQKATAEIKLEQARIEAEAVTVTADAEAYAKKAVLEADGALTQKLTAWVDAQKVWADAASKINVPTTVFGGSAQGSALGTVSDFMAIVTAKAASDLALDLEVKQQ